jgi:2-dehydro-3-deoxyphosphogluconate aldolase / (4S)-4-hydroxy-2-oxoglutarate aldolase
MHSPMAATRRGFLSNVLLSPAEIAMAADDSTVMIEETFGRDRVVPVLTISHAADAVPLARALAKGGLTVLEITLRTEPAIAAIKAIADAVPEVIVGAGTVTDPDEAAVVRQAGARFIVSPGLSEPVLEAARASGIPCLPGVATATEMMRAQALGLTRLKFFPASIAGGVAALKAFAGPFPRLRFCPTGGVEAADAADYLALPNVFAVGGSWIAPTEAVRAGDWNRIEMLARAAVTGSVRP